MFIKIEISHRTDAFNRPLRHTEGILIRINMVNEDITKKEKSKTTYKMLIVIVL